MTDVVPVSQTSVSRLMSDGSIERVDPVTTAMPAGIVPLNVADSGFPGFGIQDANGQLRASITFADDGGIVLKTHLGDGSFMAEVALIGDAVIVHHGVLTPGSDGMDLSNLPVADPHVAGRAYVNAGAVKVSAG